MSIYLYTGRVLHNKDQYGTETVFRYDSLGNLVEEIVELSTAWEARQKSKYLVDKESTICEVTKTDAKGTHTSSLPAVLERVVWIEKQGITQHANTTAMSMRRVMQKIFYNAVGQPVQVEEMGWLI